MPMDVRTPKAATLFRVACVAALWIAGVFAIQVLLKAQRRSAEAAAPVLRSVEETEAAERAELDRLLAAPPAPAGQKPRLASPALCIGGYRA